MGRGTSTALELAVVALASISMACAASVSDLLGYDVDGPLNTTQQKYKVPISEQSGCNGRQLSVTVTYPVDHNGTYSRPSLTAPYPVVVFFNGFKFKTYFYTRYMHRLASWGYVTLQYDTPFLEIIPDSVELGFLQPLLEWAALQNSSPGGLLTHKMDLLRIGVAGHSRGAKLAALHFAGMPSLLGAYLIDPVDNTSHTPEGPQYPSACKALLSCGRAVGITGAGVTGSCSPEGSNFKNFYSVTAPGSWLTTIPASGHSQLADAGSLWNKLLDALCGKGANSREETISLALPPFLAWMEQHVRGTQAPLPTPTLVGLPSVNAFDPVAWFMKWVKQQQAVGLISFQVKPEANEKFAAAAVMDPGLVVNPDVDLVKAVNMTSNGTNAERAVEPERVGTI